MNTLVNDCEPLIKLKSRYMIMSLHKWLCVLVISIKLKVHIKPHLFYPLKKQTTFICPHS